MDSIDFKHVKDFKKEIVLEILDLEILYIIKEI